MPSRRESRRFLATLLFTDIVGSTGLAARVGDREWRRLLELHNRAVRQQLRHYQGREMDTAGDGFFAAFDVPENAVRCAVAISAAVAPLGLEVRAGVHTGECELIGGKAGGMAVNIAARIMALAGAGQVLVSSSVRDMTVGSGLRFGGGEERTLKGVADAWRVFELTKGGAEAGVGAPARQRRSAAALVAGPLALVLVSGLVAARTLPSHGSDLRADVLGVLDKGGSKVSLVLPVGQRPADVAVDETTAWITNSTSDNVSRVDRRTHAVTPIPVGSGPQGVAIGAGRVWVANSGDGTVSRIIPETNATAAIPVGSGPFGVVVAEGSVWVTNALDASVSRIDPASERVRQTITVGAGPSGIAYGEHSIWVANEGDGTVARLDPTSGKVQGTPIVVGNGPTGIAVGAGAVWVANNTDGSLSRIDPQDLSVTTTRIASRAGTFGVAVQGNAVWVTNQYAGTLSRIDARTQRVTKTIGTDGAPLGLAFGGGQLWFTNAGGGSSLHRGGTLRLVGSSLADLGESSATVVDPFDSYDSGTWRALSVTNDGLVGIRRESGAPGALPVADLATSLPAPTDGGLSYSFTLRPGRRYSTGQPVLAGDLRRGLERSLRRPAPDAFLFDAVRGAASCGAAPKVCDLSEGIVTDDAAGTVTFHLTHPDPAFLYKLTLPTADALPPGVPDPLPAGQAFPATGPYMVKSYQRQQTDGHGNVMRHGHLVLVRNPHFTEWSSAAQPDGYADSIVLETGFTSAEAIAEVTGGRADALWLSVDSQQLAGLGATRADEVHSHVLPWTNYVFLNTRVPPFNNADARRAVAYALDRGAMAGDPDAVGHGQVACQVLPPQFPGYRPYCPFTLGSDTSTWRAPDLKKAQDLVSASGTAGARVTFYSLDDPAWLRTAKRAAGTLTELGYPTTLKAVGERFFDEISDSRVHAQAGLIGWASDYPAPSTFFDNLVSCASFRPASPQKNTNYSEYCDASVDSQIRRALKQQGEDPASAVATWASVDRAVTDAAPLVAYSYNVSADLVGRRVGNYQWNLQLGMLIAQMYVQ